MLKPATITVRRAGEDDVDQVVSIVREATDWLEERGYVWLRQFPGGTPQRVADGLVWLAAVDGEDVATVALVPTPDPELWNADESDAVFVHGLAVRRKAAGLGVGSALLTFALDRAAHAGVPWVRLDCNKNNERLQAYYQSEGFTYLRTIDLPHRNTGALFQKPSERSSTVRTEDGWGDRFFVELPESGRG